MNLEFVLVNFHPLLRVFHLKNFEKLKNVKDFDKFLRKYDTNKKHEIDEKRERLFLLYKQKSMMSKIKNLIYIFCIQLHDAHETNTTQCIVYIMRPILVNIHD